MKGEEKREFLGSLAQHITALHSGAQADVGKDGSDKQADTSFPFLFQFILLKLCWSSPD